MDIQDKIRKLYALARDSAATESEAANALEMATALMAKYNIEHIPDKSNVKGDRRTFKKKLQNWQSWLITICGRLNGCKGLKGKISGTFAGQPEDTRAAWEMYDFLDQQVERLYKRDLPRGMSQKERAEYRRTYKQACSVRIYARAEEILLALRTKDNQIPATKALVVAQSFDQRYHEAEEFVKSQGVVLRSRTTKIRWGKGTYEGLKAGDEVKINHTLRSNS